MNSREWLAPRVAWLDRVRASHTCAVCGSADVSGFAAATAQQPFSPNRANIRQGSSRFLFALSQSVPICRFCSVKMSGPGRFPEEKRIDIRTVEPPPW